MKYVFRSLVLLLFIWTDTVLAQTYTINVGGTISTCSGTFYDSGNSGGNYGADEYYTITFCPAVAGQKIQVSFSSFSLESGYDWLDVYNGNSTASPYIGGYSGTSPGTIVSSSANGCLTFLFTSDDIINYAGWVATVSCVNPPILISAGGTVTTCSATFTDAGGTSGNYGNNQDYTITFCPSVAGQAIQVSFSSFDLENWSATYDRLYVYDGTTTAATLIGSYSGTTLPGNIIATNASGCLTFRFRSDGSTTYSGWVAQISCTAPPPPTYPISNGGTLSTCSATFTDAGGSSSDYGFNQNYTMTICPSVAGQCVRATFSSFNVESGYDFLYVYDGSSTAATQVPGSPFSGTTSPGIVTATSTNASGCLTFRFTSDGYVNRAGWVASISCAACPSGPVYSPQDCYGANTLCSNQSFTGNSGGSGTFNDVNSTLGNIGCLNDGIGNGEHQSSWYYFSPSSNGTLGMTITPNSTTDDYDWAIWGPVATISCPPSGNPVRCSAADGNGTPANITGLGNGASDNSEGPYGNGWVQSLNVTAGQKYILLLDNWNATGSPFTLSWQMSGGASLDCTPLPVEFGELTGKVNDKYIDLNWVTYSELNNSLFVIEKLNKEEKFTEIGYRNGSGNSNEKIIYDFRDLSPEVGMNYYRLRQEDYDGSIHYSKVIGIDYQISGIYVSNIFPNPATEKALVELIADNSHQLKFSLVNSLGSVMLTRESEVHYGKNTIELDLSSLHAGLYIMDITSANGFRYRSKIMISEK